MTDIKNLNDNFRKTFFGGKVLVTMGIRSKSINDVSTILARVRNFNNFTKGNDPYGEHDFGRFAYKGDKIFWKIDYYDENLKYASENPPDISKTKRVMTIMLADEY